MSNSNYKIVDSFVWTANPYQALPNWYRDRVEYMVGSTTKSLIHITSGNIRTEIGETVCLLETGDIAISLPLSSHLFQLSLPKTTTASSNPNNMFDFRVMDDEDWEYLSEMNRAREAARKAAESPSPSRCREHKWVNISLLNVKEVCKVCDVERDSVEGKK
jgi:hypothetical protein